jgi:Carboxypeptidase regulatory-like domain
MAKVALCSMLSAFLSLGVLVAQQSTASLNGSVADSTGAVIADADLSLRNVATNVERHTLSNSVGYYVFVNIAPGNYTLEAGKSGFATKKVQPFTLSVNQTATIDFSLARFGNRSGDGAGGRHRGGEFHSRTGHGGGVS